MRRAALAALAAFVALASGCASIPTSGPVQEVPFSAQPRGIDIAPEPPTAGVTPNRLVDGFLQAMADPTDSFAVARQYLTADAAGWWRPSTAQVIQATVTTDLDGVTRTDGKLLGTLDEHGSLTSTDEAFSFEFGLVKEDGEWRIGSPPDGLLLSRYIFERYYSRVPLYFMSRAGAGTHVVPDLRHFPEAEVVPAMVVEALLEGPSEPLMRTVTNAIPGGVSLGERGASLDTHGVVTVDLSGLDPDMTVEERGGLGAQLLWSLTAIPRVTGLVLTNDGGTFPLPGSNAAGVLELAGQQGYQVLSRGSTPNLFGVSDGVPGRLGEDSRFVPLMPRVEGTADVAVSLDGVTAAYVDETRTRLSLGQLGGQFTSIESTYTNLRSPQFALGTVWLLGDDESQTTRLLTVARSSELVDVALELPAGGALEGFAVSPSRDRVALVVKAGGTRELGITALLPSGTQTSGWWPLTMVSPRATEITDIVAVSWQSETALAFIGSTTSGRSVYTAQSDGSLVEEIGPVNGDPEEITAMARLGGGAVAIRNESGTVWRYEARTRWTRIIDGVTAIGFGS
ncbi:MAG: LpqB family beta-propeller domain-containing protein [Arachnia sp.]